MKYFIPFQFSFIFSLFSFISCNFTFQYGVNVYNKTNHNLRIEFESGNDLNNTNHQTINLKPQEFKRIIWTKNIPNTKSWTTTAKHCNLVANYVKAFNQNNIESSKKWCHQSIRFEKTDIQQGEFYIEYEEKDFE